MTHKVQEHYGAADITSKIFAAIPWNPDRDALLSAEQLYPFDQLHGRELLATRDHAARLDPQRDDHLLDVGSGIGGPARYFAATYGCRVTGIDVTPEFVAAARDLTSRCGLGDHVTFIETDAVATPAEDESFDHAYSFYVGMNLPDKLAILTEIFRLMKPGGRLIWTEVTAGEGAPTYPLPWSDNAADSHVRTREDLLDHFTAAGFRIQAVEDETHAHLELAKKMKDSNRLPTPDQMQANQVVLGQDFVARRMNYIASLGEGTIASTLIEARKPL